jgi:hypothetical protein
MIEIGNGGAKGFACEMSAAAVARCEVHYTI